MQTFGDAYLGQTRWGNSKWWAWGMVLWFTMLGWLLVQVMVGGPLNQAMTDADPEVVAQMNESMTALVNENAGELAVYSIVFLMSTVLGLIFFLINRLNKDDGIRKVTGVITGLFVIGSVFGLFRLFPLINDPEANALMGSMIGKSALVYALFLVIFPMTVAGLYLGYKFIHKRSIKSLHTAAKKIRWGRGLQAFFITWMVLGAATAIGHFSGLAPVSTHFDSSRFAVYAIISLIFLPMQSGTEEILFRGYLNQGFTHLLKNKWAAFIITSLLFMSVHLANPEALSGKESGILPLVMSSYFFFGFFACLMVWIDDGLESAIGFHAANNTFAAIFVNYEGSVLPTPSMFIGKPNPAMDIPVALLAMAAITGLISLTRKPLDPAPIPTSQSNSVFE